MAVLSTIPPPPYLGPFPVLPKFPGGARPLSGVIYSFQPDRGGWTFYGFINLPWDALPLGYYRTPPGFTGVQAIFIVTQRQDAAGVVQPNVLNPQDAPTTQAIDSWDGTGPVPASELNIPAGVDGGLGYWTIENNLPVYDANLAVSKIPTCPPGTVWDPTTESCKPISVPPPPPPKPPPRRPPPPPPRPPQPPPPPPGTPPQPCQPDTNPGDELTNGLNCIIENLIYLQYQLSMLSQNLTGQPTNLDPVTCTQLTGLVTATNSSLLAIAQSIAAVNSGAPVDLSAVVGAIGQLAAALQSFPPIWQACCNALGAKLDGIATAISSTGGTDLTPVVKAIEDLFSTIDVPPSIVQQLVAGGYLNQDAENTIGQGAFGSVLVTTIVNFAYKAITNYLATFGIKVGPAGITATNPADTIANDLGALFSGVLTIGDKAILPSVQNLVGQVKALLVPPGPTQLGVINVSPDAPVAAAISVALTAAAVAWLLSFAGVDEGESLTRMAEIVAGAVGFEELRDVVLGPLVRQGIALVAERQAKARFQQELPGTTSLQTYVAMGLLSPARAKALSLLNGTSDELYPISQAASYRGLNARQMLRLIETDLFSASDIADELTFSAMRPASQARMLQAAPYLATNSERSSLRSTLESAYVAGLLSDADLQTQVLGIESNTDLAGLVLSRARLQKLIAETKALETEYTALFVGGLLDDATYRANLSALGLQPDAVNMIAARAEARANVTANRRNLADAARAAKALQKAVDQAALKNFADGNIDAVALSGALIASGVVPTQAAALVDLAVLRKAGSLRWQYGLQLPPQQATLLRGRVAALTDQRKRLQITDPVYVAQLQALGIPPKYVNALQAAADALISPKTAAFPITVETT